MIKRYVCFTLTFFLLIAFASCAKQPDPIQNDEDYFILPEPDIPILELFSSDDSNPLGFSMEEDYSMIRASTEKSVYPTDFEKIDVVIMDHNPGKAFWLFSVPFLKHQTEKETILIPFDSKLHLDVYNEGGLWGVCGTVGNTTESNRTKFTVKKDNYVYSFVPGTYIICVYVGDRVLELPITLE